MSQPLTASTNAPHPTLAALPNLFLLNPDNCAFVKGTSRSIVLTSNVFVVSAILVVVTCLILIDANLKVNEWETFIHQERVVTEGSVVGRFIRTTDDGDGGTETSYTILYRFSVPAIEKGFQTGSQDIGEAGFNRIPDGSVVSITYLAADPNTSWITEYEIFHHRDPKREWYLLSLSACVVTLLALGWAIRYAWRKRRLAQRGQLIRGHVAGWHLEERGDEGVKSVMTYEFETPSGRKIVTRTITKHYELPPEIGTPVVILYINDQFYEML